MRLTKLRLILPSLVAAGVGAAAITWFFTGAGLSEDTARRLALDEATKFAARNRIDFTGYEAAASTNQPGQRLYMFEWHSKSGEGRPLVVIVDPVLVNVSVLDLPSSER